MAHAQREAFVHAPNESNRLHDHRPASLRSRASVRAERVSPEHVPLQKTIGQTVPDIVPSLIVVNARGASLQDGKLTLTGVSPNSIVFAGRPAEERIAESA